MAVKFAFSGSQLALAELQAFLEKHPELGTLVAPAAKLQTHAAVDSSPQSNQAADAWLKRLGNPEFQPLLGDDEVAAGPGYWDHPIGLSAKAVYCFFRRDPGITARLDADASHPLDADDFGRCAALFDAVPEWRQRVGELSILSPAWDRLATNWGTIEEAYRADNSEETSRLIRDFLKDIQFDGARQGEVPGEHLAMMVTYCPEMWRNPSAVLKGNPPAEPK